MVMKVKTKIMLFLINILMLGIVLPGCGEISILPKEVQIELGEEVPSNVTDYIYIETHMSGKIQSNVELDVSGIDSMTVGEYEAKIYYRGNMFISKVSVSDTTPPEILLKDTEFSAGNIVSANDLAEVKDFSDVTLKILCRYPDGEELLVDFINLGLGNIIELKAVDEYGNETIVKTVPIIYEVPCQEENQNDRSYDSFLDFPYEMTYVDEEAYQYIQKIYTSINWYSEFETGDLTQYDFYKEKYKELINGQKPFFNPEIGTEMYLDDFESIENKGMDNYYFFDMDKDNAPEICLQSEKSISVFKYDIDKEQFLLWKYIEQGHYDLNGSLAMRWDNGSGAVFYNLDQKGNEICSVSFMIRNAYNEMIGPRYLVSLPRCAETDKNEYDKNILEQGYYDRGQSIYYFRVTETQYDELIKDYEKAYETAKYGLQNVTYSYGELFGE